MNKRKVGILTVDMQDFWFRRVATKNKENFVKDVLGFLTRAEDILNDNYFWFKEYQNSGFSLNSIRELRSYSNERVIETGYRDVFFMTDLEERLKSVGISDLVILGTCACRCVLETVKGAMKANFNVVTSPDLIKRTSIDNFDYLKEYEKVGASVLSSRRDVLKYISRNR